MQDSFSDKNAGSREASSISSTLLDRVRESEGGAWERLVHLFGPVVYRWCRQFGASPTECTDLVQDVFAAVATHVERFRRDRPEDSFRGWLWTITRSKVQDHFRRLRDRPRAQGGSDALDRLSQIPDQPPESSGTDRQPDDAIVLARRALELIRSEIEDRTWRAFWRTTAGRESGADVAEDLGMTVRAVYQAKYRVLRRVREELGDLLS